MGQLVDRYTAAAYRVPVQKGHLVDVRVRFRKPAGSAKEVAAALTNFNPLRDVPLPSKPRQTIYVKPLDDDEEEEQGDGVGGVGGVDGAGGAGGVGGVGGVGGAGAGEEDKRRKAPQPRLGTPRPKDDCEFESGMSICVGNIVTDDELYDCRFCLVVNNVVRGAWGAALLNAEYWHWLMAKKKKAAGAAAGAGAAGESIEC
jgi:aspartate-semialdehyde dehydrogenase